ncbi:hypothetical protein [Streptomyces sp. CBMA123]|uniref:hypothetical protein n=1 Tax=Streptomyces sp. CBMA123 TaxID=1896313 RepID=UPI0016620B60|nr:hypothetical protein [Streptomyces sp. CBMA123]MBD0689634.1 hypothetical protein [Streptomyces sp. CBMA123]
MAAKHYRKRDDGKIGCNTGFNECDALATRWMDFLPNGALRVSTAYCAEHGDWELKDSQIRERNLRQP